MGPLMMLLKIKCYKNLNNTFEGQYAQPNGHRYCRGNRSDSRVKHELSNLKVPDQTKDRALATESATFVTSYSLNVAAGLPHNFSIPNFSLEGDGVHSQLFNWLVFELMKSKVIRDLEKAR
ncbi:hypothetical protein Tco_0949695 [Tanacetum coccineum]